MIIERKWCMPNKNTFEIKPIKELVNKWIANEQYQSPYHYIIDPFANNCKIADYTNDLDPQYDTDCHMDALDFLKTLSNESATMVLYDPPFSVRQVSESYKKLGMSVNMETTQASYWSKQKDEIARILIPGGICISCGWNTNGIGKTRGFKIEEILLVAHGGPHNDTIITVERKL